MGWGRGNRKGEEDHSANNQVSNFQRKISFATEEGNKFNMFLRPQGHSPNKKCVWLQEVFKIYFYCSRQREYWVFFKNYKIVNEDLTPKMCVLLFGIQFRKSKTGKHLFVFLCIYIFLNSTAS